MTTEIITEKFDALRGRLLGNRKFSVIISVVTQSETLVAVIAYGCPYYTDPAILNKVIFDVPEISSCVEF